jgi:hypothetical protein
MGIESLSNNQQLYIGVFAVNDAISPIVPAYNRAEAGNSRNPLKSGKNEHLIRRHILLPDEGQEELVIPEISANDGEIVIHGLYDAVSQRVVINARIRGKERKPAVRDASAGFNIIAMDALNPDTQRMLFAHSQVKYLGAGSGLYKLHTRTLPVESYYQRGMVRGTGSVVRAEPRTVQCYFRDEVRIAGGLIQG